MSVKGRGDENRENSGWCLIAGTCRGLVDTEGAHGRVCSGNCVLYVDPLTVIKNCLAEHHLPPPGERDCVPGVASSGITSQRT